MRNRSLESDMAKDTNDFNTYVGLDVALAETHICVLDREGKRLFQGVVSSDPASIAEAIAVNAPNCERVAVETGATTPWLWRELRHRGIPVICIDARHANKALSMRQNKSDRNDAEGLAELMRTGSTEPNSNTGLPKRTDILSAWSPLRAFT